MTEARSPFLVTTDWLAEQLGTHAVKVVDGSWHLPAANRNGEAEFRIAHIPGAVFFDIDKVADTSSGLPHMLPSEDAFAAAAGALGLADTDVIVVYDGAGLFSAPRVWWTLRAFGAKNVFILDGGFPKWQAEGRDTETGEPSPTPASFKAKLDRSIVAGIEDVARRLEDGSAQVVDARPAARFRGEAAEPRPGVRAGHIPGSRNLPFTEIIKDGRLIAPDAIRDAFAVAGVDPDQPVVTSCGSGVSAAILWLALESIGKPPAALYDGSWAEWGSSDKPLVTGAE